VTDQLTQSPGGGVNAVSDLPAKAATKDGDGPSGQPAPSPVPLCIGLDLSLTDTGMSGGRTTWSVCSKGKATDGLPERQARLRKLRAEIIGYCENADLVVIEGPAFGSKTGHMHDRSGLWWLVVSALSHRGIAVAEVAPTTVKKYATGKGNGPKGAMVDAASRRLPQVITAGNDNRADALWLHAMGLDHLTGQTVVPESHRVALTAVRWPAVAAAR
jgi:crossover junction endodeoxyribonuclease RuvC